MKPTVVVTEGLEEGPLAWLREHANLVEVKWTEKEKLARALAEADGLIVRTYTQVNEGLLAQGPKLRAVGRAGVGLENVDLAACAARGVKVFSTPTANTRAVCEYVFNLLFHLGRPLVNLRGPTNAEDFHRYRKTVRGLELAGKTMGILGMGRIGRGVGKIAWAMQMEVIYHDVVDVAGNADGKGGLDFPARMVCKDELYGRADVLSLHVDMRAGNERMVGAETLGKMKAGAYLINTCRGEVVDAGALAAALRGGKLAGAALDVHEPEPPPPDYPLWGCPNVILAPHLAARTQGAMDAMSWVCKDVVAWLEERQ